MLSYAALGMREGVLIHLSQRQNDDATHVTTYSSAVAFAAAIGMSIPLVCAAYWQLAHGRIDLNYLLICVIGGVSVLNEVLINLNRYEGQLMRVSFCETSYNVLILVLVFAVYRVITPTLVLFCMLGAICFSAAVYLSRLRFFSLRAVTWQAVRELIATGFFSSVLSAVLIVVNLMFILVAQHHLAREEVGQFVFANNIATLLLVSLNAFSWAMTSRLIGDLASAHEEEQRRRRVMRTDLFMRLGIAGVLALALLIVVVLPWVTERYGGSSRYVLLFVALQSFQLIVFTELNFLMMKNRIPLVIGLFACANIMNYLLIETLSDTQPFFLIMIAAVFCTAAAAGAVIRYAAHVGLGGVPARGKYGSLLAILATVVLFYTWGAAAALAFSTAVITWLLGTNWKVLRHL